MNFSKPINTLQSLIKPINNPYITILMYPLVFELQSKFKWKR